jgi:hypothetical protein
LWIGVASFLAGLAMFVMLFVLAPRRERTFRRTAVANGWDM